MLVALLLANFIDVLVGGAAGDIASFASMFVLLPPFLMVQQKIKLGCGDPEGQGNDRLTKANWAWVLAGGVLGCSSLPGWFRRAIFNCILHMLKCVACSGTWSATAPNSNGCRRLQ